MKNTEKLIEAFGEFIYVVAMADGSIQEAELKTITEKLSTHKWGKDIRWSFDYERKKDRSIEELYKKVLVCCEMNGPDPEYQFLLEMADEIAKSHNGIEKEEQEVIDNFTSDLIEKFKNDINRINA